VGCCGNELRDDLAPVGDVRCSPCSTRLSTVAVAWLSSVTLIVAAVSGTGSGPGCAVTVTPISEFVL